MSTWWLVEPFGRGGVAQYAADVARLLADEAAVRLAVATGGPGLGYEGPVELWFPRVGPPPLDRAAAAATGLLRARRRPAAGDVAWVALGFRPGFERALVAALRGAGCRIVATVHNRRPHEGDGDRGTAAVAAVAGRCDAVVVHTAEMARWASSAGLAVVQLPFPPPAWHAATPAGRHSRASLGLDEDAVVVALLGNLRGYKGVDVLLDALGLLPAASPVHAVLAGQAQGWDVLGAARSAGAQDRIRLLEGYLPHGELLDVLELADAAVLPYHRIDHSGVGALVASRGVPAVASDLPGLRELLGEAARYVPPGDPAALADALAALPGTLPGLRSRTGSGAAVDPAPYRALVRSLSRS